MIFWTDVCPVTGALATIGRMNPVIFVWKEGLEEYGVKGGEELVGIIESQQKEIGELRAEIQQIRGTLQQWIGYLTRYPE